MTRHNQTPKLPPVLINGQSLTLDKMVAIAEGAEIVLSPFVKKKIEAGAAYVKKVVKQSKPVYGVNTGFGFFANERISKRDLKKLQLNLIKSHAAGYGKPLTIPETRLAMALRLNVLVKGYTGVRLDLCRALFALIKANIFPIIPEYGSVGASGDLAPLAHLALPLVGLGLVQYRGDVIPAIEALEDAGLSPIELSEKEGLGLVNGTQIMLAVGGLALAQARKVLQKADKITALTFEAMQASVDPLNPLIHELRQHPGQVASAHAILAELEGSYLLNPTTPHLRVQDPYSLRCAPQIHGPSRDAVAYACHVVEVEANAATDNPLVFAEERKILSGGNFHGQPLALAYDIAAMGLAEIGNISERRLELMLNPNISQLPAFLSPHEGLQSGYMASQYLSASLVNEDKILANPACTDSIPGNVGIEDHVSMGMTSARKLKHIVENISAILSIEMLAAAQAVDLREMSPLGYGTSKTYQKLRASVPTLKKDRIVSEDIAKAVEVFKNL